MLLPIQDKPLRFDISDNNKLYVTSDLHLFHNRIVEFTNRPTTLENHNNWVIQQCNSKVPPNTKDSKSTVLHLGDFLFSCTNEEAVEVLSQLNGDWWFVLGNHDRASKLVTVINTVNKEYGTNHQILGWYYRLNVVEPQINITIKQKKKLVILCHFPIAEWDSMDRYSFHLFGHMHGGTSGHTDHPLPFVKGRLDCGIDNHPKHEPFTWEEIRSEMRKQRNEVKND